MRYCVAVLGAVLVFLGVFLICGLAGITLCHLLWPDGANTVIVVLGNIATILAASLAARSSFRASLRLAKAKSESSRATEFGKET